MSKVFFPSPSQVFVQQQEQRPSLKSSFPSPVTCVCPTTKAETMTKVFFPFPSHVFVQQIFGLSSMSYIFLQEMVGNASPPQSRVCPTTKAKAMFKVFYPFPSHVFVQQQKQRLCLKSSFPSPVTCLSNNKSRYHD